MIMLYKMMQASHLTQQKLRMEFQEEDRICLKKIISSMMIVRENYQSSSQALVPQQIRRKLDIYF